MAARPKPQQALKARALQLLSQREHSRVELRRKLMARAVGQCEAPVPNGCETPTVGAEALSEADAKALSAQTVEALLDWLEAHRYLSPERFVESRVHARAERFGNVRIRQELKQHGLVLSDEAARALAHSELQRAQGARERKFGPLPTSTADRARQARFLAQRGFSADAIQRVLGRRNVTDAD